jgi:uncharacterized protein YbjT (DUF2867 family)
MTAKLITIFGGSGFVGRHVVRALAKRGHRIRVAVRRPDLAGHLQPLGTVSQIQPIQANLRYPNSVAAAVKDADAVINLVGILAETGRQTFSSVQAEGTRAVAQACQQAGISNFVQISALGADANSNSIYSQTKAYGEHIAQELVPNATIIRPSIVFGPEDNFFNQFAALARVLPVLPLIGGGETKFQPVFVGDVADLIARVIDGEAQGGRVYELGGPDVMSFKQILEYILKVTGRKRLLLPLPFPVAMVQAAIMEWLPGQMLTRDQVRLLAIDNVVSDAAHTEKRTLEGGGIHPSSVEAIVPSYLYRFRKAGQFEKQKAETGEMTE